MISSLVGISCALLGTFLVLKRMSMLGDAISHAILPGLVFAFLVSGSRASIPMFLGAAALGVLTALITDTLHRHGKLQEDASIGVTFTWLFAVGVILISAFAGKVDLDQDCVLYGEIAFAPLDTLSWYGHEIGPRSFWILLGVTIVNILFVTLSFNRLALTSFDKVLARSLGVATGLWHYLLMTFVSVTTVASFESVGAILVVAMLVVPANTAYLVSRSLKEMLIIAVGVAIISSIGGYYLAALFDASIAAATALVSGLCFIFVLLVRAFYEKQIISWARYAEEADQKYGRRIEGGASAGER